MYAAKKDQTEAVEVLLEHEKGMSDNQEHNALLGSQEWAHSDRQGHRAHEDPTDENNVTALMRAAARGDAEMVRLLAPLQKGAKDKDGNTAFFMPSGPSTKASLCS